MANDSSNIAKLAALQDSDSELIAELAGLSPLDYDRRRKEAAEELSVESGRARRRSGKAAQEARAGRRPSPATVSACRARHRSRRRSTVCCTGLPTG